MHVKLTDASALTQRIQGVSGRWMRVHIATNFKQLRKHRRGIVHGGASFLHGTQNAQLNGVRLPNSCGGQARSAIRRCRGAIHCVRLKPIGRDESRPYNKIHRLLAYLHFKFRKQETDRAPLVNPVASSQHRQTLGIT
jgi:hypothetical protein